ncbi:MAG: hypothetical protein JO114_11700 [Planctomycetaceae bacterium]|nr:hypothetical protein [Planctomycetaceae bacterium]
MSSNKSNEGGFSAADPARDFLEFWKNYFEQTAIQTRILVQGMQEGKSLDRKSLDQLHAQGLESLSQSLEGFMRTPAFLEVLKQSLKRMIDLKRMQDQVSQSVAQQTGLPMAADVTGVFERVHSAEQTILARLGMLDDRLKAIENTLNSSPAEKNPKRKTATTKEDIGDDDPKDPADWWRRWRLGQTETSGYP